MKQGHFEEHWADADGIPTGRVSSGRGFTISWQNGPLGRHSIACEQYTDGTPDLCNKDECTRRPPNGAFVEDALQAIIGRIEFYERSQFACDSNKLALRHLKAAAVALR